MQKSLIIALGLSIAVNIFAVGHLSGRAISTGRDHPRPIDRGMGGVPSPFALMREAESLPPDVRDAFRARIRETLPNMRDQARALYREREAMGAVLAAPEFDRAKAEQSLARMQEIRARQNEAIGKTLLDALESLSADDRKLLVERYRNRSGRHRRGHRHHGERRRDFERGGEIEDRRPPSPDENE